ncbi:hypothetical protein [Flagellimonas sp.]|uniref:hypothetical protein n=1 Tax=Flagellimonas sp. TaxID=2058762 RepID=UPI003F49FA88
MTQLIRNLPFAVLCIAFTFYGSFAQTKEKLIYDWFDQQTGQESSALYNGVQYVNEFVIFDGKHQFFDTDSFVRGSVVYDNNRFSSVSFKYDIFNDDLILAPFGSSGSFPFKLIRSKVQRFSFEQNVFVNVNTLISSSRDKNIGFCKVVREGDSIQTYQKIWKTPRERNKQGRVYYEFLKKERFYLVYKNSLYAVDGKGDWIAVFPSQKETIKSFFQDNKKQLKTEPELFYMRLSTQIDSQLQESSFANES